MKYRLKDKEKYEKFVDLFVGFDERFQEACKHQIKDSSDHIIVQNMGGSNEKRFYSVEIPKAEIEIIESLNTNVWYPIEKFDGNPNKHILIEYRRNGIVNSFVLCAYKIVSSDATHFMYLERPFI